MGHVDAVKLLQKFEADPDVEVRVKKHRFSSEKIVMAGEYFESSVTDKKKKEIMRTLVLVDMK